MNVAPAAYTYNQLPLMWRSVALGNESENPTGERERSRSSQVGSSDFTTLRN
jgi:hypothetical protein